MTVRFERNGPVTTVVLSRPERRNAIDRATAEELSEAFREFEGDAEAKVGVLWGEGGSFCSGADLKAMFAETPNRLEPEGDAPLGPSRLELSKPVIAAISDHAVAGGLELALWCDLRIAEEDSILGVFCRRFGVPLIDGGTVRLPRLIGLSRALDLILTGRAVGAQEALQIGLINRVVDKGNARVAAEELALDLAAFPQEVMRADRLSALHAFDAPLPEAMAREFRKGLEAMAMGGLEELARFPGNQK